jgi:NADPH-dependent curcumin reductase CurA
MRADNPLWPLALGGRMDGPALAEVVESRSARFEPGQLVVHMAGWRDEAVVSASRLTGVPSVDAPGPAFLGVLGYPGMTAYVGLFNVAKARAGDVVFLSGAAGAVGTAAIQMAKAEGMTVIASAGGPQKCALAAELGADVSIDYKSGVPIQEALREAAPDGIDVYFDNVGGDHLDAALLCAKWGARFAMCGMVSGYDSTPAAPVAHLDRIISAELTLKGFEVFSYEERRDEFEQRATEWFRRGDLRSVETVRAGLENMPAAFRELFSGSNFGKLVVEV